MRPLADVLRRDAFPALKELNLSGNREFKDEGVVALAAGLLMANQTFFTKLNLRSVDVGDAGITAITYLIYAGRMRQLKELNLYDNMRITD